MTEANEEVKTLQTGQYTIEFSNGPSQVYRIDGDHKEWVCSTPDPEVAMQVVEGLILVEHKRFYHPEAQPKVQMAGSTATEAPPVPKFLKRK